MNAPGRALLAAALLVACSTAREPARPEPDGMAGPPPSVSAPPVASAPTVKARPAAAPGQPGPPSRGSHTAVVPPPSPRPRPPALEPGRAVQSQPALSPAARSAALPSAAPAARPRPPASASTAAIEPRGPAHPPSVPLPVLSPQVDDEERVASDITARLGHAGRVIDHIDPHRLSPDQREMFASIRDFVSKARDALSSRDYPRAEVLSEKASTLANELATAAR